MTDLHPYRYPSAFRSQLARLERLYPGCTQSVDAASHPGSITIEQTGSPYAEMVSRNRRLRHLEALIADWVLDGETVYDAAPGLDDLTDNSVIRLEDIPRPVSFVSLPDSEAFALRHRPKSTIEGFYVREIVQNGTFSAELTFVCAEPGWQTMDSCLYADAMDVGGRICVATIPLEVALSMDSAMALFDGEKALLEEPALKTAITSASDFTLSFKLNQHPSKSHATFGF